jgi:hypothetical protein
LAETDGGRGLLDRPSPSPDVVAVQNLRAAATKHVEDGWVPLGQSSWIGADVGSESDARSHAQKIGASLVLWSYSYSGSSTASVPFSTPTVTNTYGGGTVYGTAGAATWTGSATTYGTSTTYVPVTVHRFQVDSLFLARRAKPPILGVVVRRMSPEEQQVALTTKGVVVDIVIRQSPAQQIGIVPGDVIQRIAGREVNDELALVRILEEVAGADAEIVWVRGASTTRQSVSLNP